MPIEDEIAQVIDKALDGDCGYGVGAHLASTLAPLLNRVRAEAAAEALRKFRADLIGSQFVQYGIVLPDINEVVDALDEAAVRIGQNREEREGNET